MTVNKKAFQKEIERVKDLILKYQYGYRSSGSRSKINILSSLLKKCQDAATRKDNQVLDIYYNELKLCD